MERALVLFTLIMQARGEGDRWRWKEFFTFQPTLCPINHNLNSTKYPYAAVAV